MIYYFPDRLTNSINDYSLIIEFYNSWKNLNNSTIIIDFSKTVWLEANYAAILGAIFDEITGIEYMNSVVIQNLSPNVAKVFQKNNFLSYFGFEKQVDVYDTTVEYRKIKSDNVTEFTDYLNNELFTQNRFPDMPDRLKNILISSLDEIFINAGMHAGCEYVYTCGQFFPASSRLDFSIVNLGTTFKENVEMFYREANNINNVMINATNAINWAIKEKTSTKVQECGGFGLSKTKDFIEKNKGQLHIISDSGCLFVNNCGSIELGNFRSKFGGTIVNFEINMNDQYNYDII